MAQGLSAWDADGRLLVCNTRYRELLGLPEGVAVPNFQRFMGEDGAFRPDELVEKSANTMLGELLRWTEALKPLRAAAA